MNFKNGLALGLSCLMVFSNLHSGKLSAERQINNTDEILHLTFDDEDAKDFSGLQNHGTIAGDITFVEGVKGKAAHIINANGNKNEIVEQYIDFGNDKIRLGRDDFTVTFWYRGLEGDDSGGAILADKDYGSGSNKGFAIGSFPNDIRANLGNGSTRKDSRFTEIDGGNWHHSAVTLDRDGDMTTYTDGKLVNSVDISTLSDVEIGVTDFVIGADTNKKNGLLNSVIDEVRIFKSLKTADEIEDIYSEFIPENPEESAEEVLYVNFDDNVNDQSGKNNHGTAIGNPTYTNGVENKALHIVNDNGSTANTAKRYVDFGKKTDLQFGSDNFSLSYWYRSDNGSTNGASLISNKDFDSGSNTGFNVGIFENGFRFNFTPTDSSRFDAYDMAPIDGVWHHVAINVDRGGKMETYLDGEKRKESNISGERGSIDAGNFVIGADGYFKYGVNDAYIDELHVYRGLQEESDIKAQFTKQSLKLAYDEASAFYEQEHTNEFYDKQKLNALQSAITNAKKAIDEADYSNAQTLIDELTTATQAVKDSADSIISGQMMYVNFDDESADDVSGRGNHGKIQGDIAFEEGIKGKAARIINTNGSTMNTAKQYINYGKPNDLQFEKDDFSIGFWFKSNQGGGSESAIISNKDWSSGNNVGFTIASFDTSSRMNFTAVQGKRKDIMEMKINDDAWHYVVMNADRDNKLSAYIDGVFHSETDISEYYDHSIDVEDFVIGADGLKTQGINDALIDEVRVFNRLMTMDEMQSFYLPSMLDMQIEQGEVAIEQAKADGYASDKIKTFEKVIKEVKEECENADADTVKKLIERIQNALDYFNIEKDASFTFNVISDVHITENNRTSKNSAYLINAFQDLIDLSPNTKAIMIPGDITDGGSENQYKGFFDIAENFTPSDVKLFAAIGNHDVRWLCSSEDRNEPGISTPTCKEGTNPFAERYLSGNQKYMDDAPKGQLYFDNWVDGYHFITLNTEQDLKDNAYLSVEQLEWLDKTLAEGADPKKPIFVQIHQPFKGTAGTNELDWVGEQEEELKAILSKYPQAITFTGHVHDGLDVLDVYQGSWGHLVDVPSFYYKSYGSKDSLGVGYQIDVNGTNVKIRVRDFINNTWLDEYEMNFDITDPMPKDPTDASMDLDYTKMSVTTGSAHAGEEAVNVLDNDESTIWHSEWTGSTVEKNHLLFDLKGEKLINGLRYLPRQGSTNGTITKYEIQISDDGKTFTKVAEGDWKLNSNWKIAEFKEQKASFIKLIAIEAHNFSGDAKIASAAEVRITHPQIVDKTALKDALAQASKLDKDTYTTESWSILEDAVTHANEIMNKVDATEEEVLAAITNLVSAIDKLVEKGSEAVDKAELQTLVDKVKKLDEEKYTTESYRILKTALDLAEEILKKTDASDAEVTAVLKALQEAFDNLKVKEDLPNGTPEVDKKPTPNTKDNSNTLWWMSICLLAGTLVVKQGVRKRRID